MFDFSFFSYTLYNYEIIAFEADSSLFAYSATQDSTQSKTRSWSAYITWIHTHTANLENEEDSKLRYYIHCIIISIYKTTVTTNMRAYLQTKHDITIERELGSIQVIII